MMRNHISSIISNDIVRMENDINTSTRMKCLSVVQILKDKEIKSQVHLPFSVFSHTKIDQCL